MARLSDQLIDRIKQEISLQRLLESQGYVLTRQGKDYATRCPFHEDESPSLIVSPNKNLYHCFGCDAGGTVIDWVMQTQGISFRHAVELLDKNAPLSESAKAIKHGTTQKINPLAASGDCQTALRRVIDYYHETLKQSPEAIEYLDKRGLNHPELIDTFKLGFANRTLAYRLPEKNRQAGSDIRRQLQAIGILRDSGHEHFNGSLVVPIMDEHGVITEVYGRKLLGKRLRKGTSQHLYLPGPHQGIWNAPVLKASKEIIICEALIDAMTFWVHGFRNVTASYGTQGFTDEHRQAFKDHHIEKVLIAYDRDEAGNTAAEQLAKQLTEQGIDCFRILFPKGMDANEYALKLQPSEKSLGLVIRKAEWLGSGQKPAIHTINDGNDFSDAELQTADEAPNRPSLAATAATAPTISNPGIDADITDNEVKLTIGDRQYRIRGLEKNLSYDQLKINILVNRGDAFHVDTLDVYSARHRSSFINQAAVELGVSVDALKRDLGKVLLQLEALQDEKIKDALKPKDKPVLMSDAEVKQALSLLNDKNLLNRILDDLNHAGVVGEETNKLVGYLACVSRKLDKPLAVIIQSSSAAGKSSLMDAILNLMPAEERVQYSAMTGQSLFYMGETNLKHKILAIAEEEGAEQAAYALKLLQSDGELTIASTGKDTTTGKLETQEYRVEGPVMIFLTTTAIDIDEELLNRCLVLTVNESREQTQAIHARQRQQQTLQGLLNEESKKTVIQLHRNAQRLLRPLLVANPYAEHLTFIDDRTRTRRDHLKYLTLIKTIALLHQYQRDVKKLNHHGKTLEYIEVTLADIETANRLANDVLGRTLDELPPQTRKLLNHIHQMVKTHCQQYNLEQSDYRFSRKDVRVMTNWGNTQLKVHLKRLEDMEYVLIHRGGRGQSFEYELLYHGEGQQGDAFLMGLVDIDAVKKAENDWYDGNKSGLNTNGSGSSRSQVGGVSGTGRGQKTHKTKAQSMTCPNSDKNTAENAYPGIEKVASHPTHSAIVAV